jgi:hypothetical protein
MDCTRLTRSLCRLEVISEGLALRAYAFDHLQQYDRLGTSLDHPNFFIHDLARIPKWAGAADLKPDSTTRCRSYAEVVHIRSELGEMVDRILRSVKPERHVHTQLLHPDQGRLSDDRVKEHTRVSEPLIRYLRHGCDQCMA